MQKKTKLPKCGKVTSVSVSRLYNLGNYCNRRIDVSAVVGPGESASATLANLYWILERLGPIRKPSCFDEFEKATKKLAEQQSEWEKQNLEEWSATVSAYHTLKAQRSEALRLLDDLGGVSQYTDHKEKWEDDDPPF